MLATLADILTLWRALLVRPEGDWGNACASLIKGAAQAQAYRRVTGQMHPFLGDGSLSSLCLRGALADVPCALDTRSMKALACVLDALKTAQPDAQDMQRVRAGSSLSRASAISLPQSSQ